MKLSRYPLILSLFLSSICFTACDQIREADLIVHNARIYSVDSVFTIADAMAIKDGKILEVGAENQIKNRYTAKDEYDAKLKFVYPGFIDGHCHFLGYGMTYFSVNLLETESWDEVIERVIRFSKEQPDGWIIGRGWDQNDWENKAFPDKSELDSLFPNRPVILQRIDGHAAIANQKALDLAGVNSESQIEGGIFEKKDGVLSGILIDNAVEKVTSAMPATNKSKTISALKKAEAACLAKGLTGLSDAGTAFETIEILKELYEKDSLNIRVYAMLSPSDQNKSHYLKNGIYQDDHLNVRSFKYYADGALGSRGAYLKSAYSDEEGHRGLMVSDSATLRSAAEKLYKKGFQMNTHCIGDKANDILLDIYSEVLGGSNDRRWRIEHAQVVDQSDLSEYGEYTIIPSVQPTHATSDMYWLESRLGAERMKNAYAYKDLLDENGLIALGTDFPVEDIDPLKTFYAAVFRKDAKGFPEEGFQMENALSREEALKGMTIWNAIANFEEKIKGSLEKGKLADFIILDRDIMKVDESEVLETEVMATYIGGKKVYEKPRN